MSDSRIPGTRGHMRSDSRAEAGRLIMPQMCKRHPGGGGAAAHSLAGDAPYYGSVLPETPALEARASDLAAAWLVRRYRASRAMAAGVVGAAGLGR